MTGIIGIIIGVLVMLFGIYYYFKEKHSAESRRIYGIAILLGAAVAVISALMYFMG